LRRHKADDTVNKSPTFTLQNWINVNRAEIISDSSWIGKVDAFLLGAWSFISMKFKPSPLVTSEIVEAKAYISKIDENGFRESKTFGKRYSQTENSRISRSSHVKNRNTWKSEQWQQLYVGDFVLLRNNDRIPADVIVLSTGEPDLTCYIETKNLDGETNLKIKRGIKEFQHIQTPEDCSKINCFIDAEPPNSNLYSFNGVIHYEKTMVPVCQNHMLLRGCILRNTSWLIAIVIYTGPDTKLMLNSGPTPSKRSKVDKQINPLIVLNVVTLCFLSIIGAAGSALYSNPFYFEVAMFSGIGSSDFQSGAAVAFITFFNCFIVFQNIIPVALYISLEVTKLAQV
jgi:phospholipid-translocating ATPase